MTNYLDIFSISIIGLAASGFLIKSFRKSKNGCGSSCGSCSSGCQSGIKQFKNKVIQIKAIS